MVPLLKIPLYNDQLGFDKLYQKVDFVTNFTAFIAKYKKLKNYYLD